MTTGDPGVLAAASVPATTANRFRIFCTPTSVRIVYGEKPTPDSGDVYHGAFVLCASDARELADLINTKLLEAESIQHRGR
jgi:hypothetical protein